MKRNTVCPFCTVAHVAKDLTTPSSFSFIFHQPLVLTNPSCLATPRLHRLRHLTSSINSKFSVMPPKNASAAELGYDDEPKLSKSFDSSSNKDLMEDAGVIKMDDPMSWGKGIVNDFKRTVGTHWVEGMTNFNQKTIAVTLLMFISVIAPTLTFGAVYGKVTDNRIGTVETILATCWVGVVYSLIGGMPLVSTQDISGLFWVSRLLNRHSH